MNGEAYATGPGAAPLLPPAYTRQPLPYSPAPAEEPLHAPFFPGSALEAAAPEAPVQEWASPEAFAYEPTEAVEEVAGPPAEPAAPETDVAAAYAEPEPLPAYAPVESYAESEPLPAYAESEPLPAYAPVEPYAEYAPAPPAELVEPPVPDYDADAPLPLYAEPEAAPQPEAPIELGYGIGGPPTAAETASYAMTADLAARLEAFARQLRERGQEAVGSAFSGDPLEAALAALVSGYLAARGR